MRYAIISDIHGNLEALQAVLKRIDELRVDRTCCLGDIVGYGPDPNACVEIVRSRDIPSVMGNHDLAALSGAGAERFNPAAQAAIVWTRQNLNAGSRDFLATLPRELEIDGLALCHGTIRDLNRYVISMDDARDLFRELEEKPGDLRACFHGHTHVPVILRKHDDRIVRVAGDWIQWADSEHVVANPGSVGQPRDGDPRASFLVCDTKERTLSFFRVDYDIAACQNKINAASLPEWLALRLSLGR